MRHLLPISLLLFALGVVYSLLPGNAPGSSATTLTVLAGSELHDIEPLLESIKRDTGIELKMSYTGTLDGAERIVSGEQVDVAWFSHGKYLTLLSKERIVAQEKIMLSPVIMGVKESKAKTWGWVDNPNVTWQDIAAKSSSGELRYAMTNPASSNSGFTALVGVAAALSGKTDALTADDIDNGNLQAFFKGQALTAGSSGWLAESFLRDQASLDGMINYESVLMSLNTNPDLRERLYLIYPKEGIITADYPVMLLNAKKREAFDKLVAYLRSSDVQTRLMSETLRRPVNPAVTLGNAFPKAVLAELPFPDSAEVIDKIILAYLNKQRVPGHAFFVLDTSSSMEGDGITSVRQALLNLTGEDQSLSGQFAKFLDREELTFVTFNSGVADVQSFSVAAASPQAQTMTSIRDYANALATHGGTAIFSALEPTYQLASDTLASHPERYYSIVLLTDGHSTKGAQLDEFRDFYQQLASETKAIKTFTVLFGDASVADMNAVAELTGGRVFDGRGESLASVFKQIRGYQ
jgi:Ca-activated chloride channel homolog